MITHSSSNGDQLHLNAELNAQYEIERRALLLKYYRKQRDLFGVWASNQNKFVASRNEFNAHDSTHMEELIAKCEEVEFRHNKYHVVMKSTGSPKEMDAVAALLAHWYNHGPELLEAYKRVVGELDAYEEGTCGDGNTFPDIDGNHELIAKCEEVKGL